ncbi:MAG: hypothetical protein K2M52_04335 [Paramuribaculum sp.]|nr:hypothetical protein [Paramuribaculum sp.]
MKKSTIVLIATAVAVWIVTLVTVALIASGGQKCKVKDIVISTDSERVTKVIKPFSALTLSSNQVYSNSAISIVECDSVSTPQLTYPAELAEYISYSEINDTLMVSFQCNSDDDTYNEIILQGESPLTITTPVTPEYIQGTSFRKIAFSGTKASKLNLSNFYTIRLNSTLIDTLYIKDTDSWKYSLNINDSNIGYLKIGSKRKDSVEISVNQDSAATSCIKHLDFDGQINRKHEITLNRITVDNLSYRGDNIMINITNKAKIGNVYSDEK